MNETPVSPSMIISIRGSNRLMTTTRSMAIASYGFRGVTSRVTPTSEARHHERIDERVVGVDVRVGDTAGEDDGPVIEPERVAELSESRSVRALADDQAAGPRPRRRSSAVAAMSVSMPSNTARVEM